MNRTILSLSSLFLFAGIIGLGQTAVADTQSKIVEVRVSDAIIPGSFDSKSDAYIIGTGLFPNGCYRWAFAHTKNLPDNITEVRSYASVQSGPCIMVLVPFHKEIRLGQLTSGKHFIRFMHSDGTYLEEQLIVE